MSASLARARAREVISQVRERTGFAHEVLDARLRDSGLPLSEVGLATRLAYGALQTQGTLDETLDRYLGGKKLEPRVRDALRISAYELLFLRTQVALKIEQLEVTTLQLKGVQHRAAQGEFFGFHRCADCGGEMRGPKVETARIAGCSVA